MPVDKIIVSPRSDAAGMPPAAQNTSGDWVKVVQRVQMRVRVNTTEKKQPPLRAGMSVEVNVNAGHARDLPHFLVALFGRIARNA